MRLNYEEIVELKEGGELKEKGVIVIEWTILFYEGNKAIRKSKYTPVLLNARSHITLFFLTNQ